MTRYHVLVLVPGDTPEDEACDAASALLSPYMRDDREPEAGFKFDYALDPEEIAALSDDAGRRDIWRVREVAGRLAELQVEAILTPDGRWYETEPGELWDDEAWLARASKILQRQPQDYLALRHVLHI
jgi:hypothetical protein